MGLECTVMYRMSSILLMRTVSRSGVWIFPIVLAVCRSIFVSRWTIYDCTRVPSDCLSHLTEHICLSWLSLSVLQSWVRTCAAVRQPVIHRYFRGSTQPRASEPEPNKGLCTLNPALTFILHLGLNLLPFSYQAANADPCPEAFETFSFFWKTHPGYLAIGPSLSLRYCQLFSGSNTLQ
jgi:hypothetical protein